MDRFWNNLYCHITFCVTCFCKDSRQMNTKIRIIHEIAEAFSLSGEAAETACLLLEARARTLDFAFDEYIERYHPNGIAEKDESLPSQ